KYDRDVTIQVLQTLSIMIQNIGKQMSLYYLFSNNYINDMIVHDFDFVDNEILAYYVSFLKTISLKLDRDVINFFFNCKSAWLILHIYIYFFKHKDQMVRIAVRTLTLNVFRVNDPDLRQFITDKTAVPYFSNLVWFMKDQCFLLNQVLLQNCSFRRDFNPQPPLQPPPSSSSSPSNAKDETNATANDTIAIANINININISMNTNTNTNNANANANPSGTSSLPGGGVRLSTTMIRSQIQQGVEEQVDHYYYLEDIFLLRIRPLNESLMDQLFSHFILPVL
ncbi:armadillo-like helical domain-containing protein, partial [Reticulomyxa filosa]